MKEPFTLDMDALRAARLTDIGEGSARAVLGELSRQLAAAGAPAAPLEQQLAALLADHITMREVGKEMPSVEEAGLASVACAVAGEGYDVLLRRKGEGVLDLFRSRLAPVIAALRVRVAELEATNGTLTVRAYLDHSSGPLDARHTVRLEGETATVEETWHGPDGAQTKRYAVRLPLVSLVHLALNTTPDERHAIEARTDWRGVDASGGEES